MNAAVSNPILEVEDLSIHIRHAYGNTPVVSGVSFSVLEGENLGIVGESGCGKTLTGLSVIGLLPRLVEATGSIRWKGQDVLQLSPAERRNLMGREIGMVYQDPLLSLNPGMTVEAQLRQALRLDGDHRGGRRGAGRAQRDLRVHTDPYGRPPRSIRSMRSRAGRPRGTAQPLLREPAPFYGADSWSNATRVTLGGSSSAKCGCTT